MPSTGSTFWKLGLEGRAEKPGLSSVIRAPHPALSPGDPGGGLAGPPLLPEKVAASAAPWLPRPPPHQHTSATSEEPRPPLQGTLGAVLDQRQQVAGD